MSALTCDICGGNLAMNESGDFAVCESCGMKHTKERVKVKVQEVKGVVEITKGEAEKERLIRNGHTFIECNDLINAKKVIDTLLFDFPQDQQVINLLREYETAIVLNAINELQDKLSDTSVLVGPDMLKDCIDQLYKHHASQDNINTLNSIIKQYLINFAYTINFSKKNYKGILEYSDLDYLFRYWLEYKTLSLEGRYSPVKNIQEKITEIYLKYVSKGNVGTKFYEPHLFSINISEKGLNIDTLIDNKYMLPFFTEGFKNANSLSNYKENRQRSVRWYAFVYGRYSIVGDTCSDWGLYSEYYDKTMDDIVSLHKYELQAHNVCQYCGGEFKGEFKKVCSKCGKPKDY